MSVIHPEDSDYYFADPDEDDGYDDDLPTDFDEAANEARLAEIAAVLGTPEALEDAQVYREMAQLGEEYDLDDLLLDLTVEQRWAIQDACARHEQRMSILGIEGW